jgi:hypothetical protein
VANADAASNLGAAVSLIREKSTELLLTNDIKGCWALLDELFPRNFFHRLKLTPLPYSGGKGKKPRYLAKRRKTEGGEHALAAASGVAVNTVQITLPVTPEKGSLNHKAMAILKKRREREKERRSREIVI